MLLWRSAIGVEAARCTVKPPKVGAVNAAQCSAIMCSAIQLVVRLPTRRALAFGRNLFTTISVRCGLLIKLAVLICEYIMSMCMCMTHDMCTCMHMHMHMCMHMHM